MTTNVTTLGFGRLAGKTRKKLKYGKLTAKKAEAIPCYRLLVDIIGPYTVRREGHDDPIILKALTMMDLEIH